jgi:hypothetical protein
MLNSEFADASTAAEHWPLLIHAITFVAKHGDPDQLFEMLRTLKKQLEQHSGPLLQFADTIPRQPPIEIGSRIEATALEMSLRVVQEFYNGLWQAAGPVDYAESRVNESRRSDPATWSHQKVYHACQRMADHISKVDADRLRVLIVNERKQVLEQLRGNNPASWTDPAETSDRHTHIDKKFAVTVLVNAGIAQSTAYRWLAKYNGTVPSKDLEQLTAAAREQAANGDDGA